jgi:hypothetical protein
LEIPERRKELRRRFSVRLLASLLVFGVSQSALATEPGSEPGAIDGHQVTICHATNSASNSNAVITIDIAAWNTSGDVGHSPDHHVNAKTGDADGCGVKTRFATTMAAPATPDLRVLPQ